MLHLKTDCPFDPALFQITSLRTSQIRRNSSAVRVSTKARRGRSKAVVAEATRCRETYAVGNTAVLEDEEALKRRDILASLASRRHVDADDEIFCRAFDAALMTGIHDHLWQCTVDGKI
jgi:hypothetical protein